MQRQLGRGSLVMGHIANRGAGSFPSTSSPHLPLSIRPMTVTPETELLPPELPEVAAEKDDRPSPPRKPPDWRTILAALLLAVGAGLGWQWWRSRQSGEPAAAQQGPQAVPVEIAPVETTTLQETSEFVGTLEADRTAVLRAETDGRR